jgi:hypothetical protein
MRVNHFCNLLNEICDLTIPGSNNCRIQEYRPHESNAHIDSSLFLRSQPATLPVKQWSTMSDLAHNRAACLCDARVQDLIQSVDHSSDSCVHDTPTRCYRVYCRWASLSNIYASWRATLEHNRFRHVFAPQEQIFHYELPAGCHELMEECGSMFLDIELTGCERPSGFERSFPKRSFHAHSFSLQRLVDAATNGKSNLDKCEKTGASSNRKYESRCRGWCRCNVSVRLHSSITRLRIVHRTQMSAV